LVGASAMFFWQSVHAHFFDRLILGSKSHL
jgi:hypothetical protein